jgi:hypothetical protein
MYFTLSEKQKNIVDAFISTTEKKFFSESLNWLFNRDKKEMIVSLEDKSLIDLYQYTIDYDKRGIFICVEHGSKLKTGFSFDVTIFGKIETMSFRGFKNKKEVLIAGIKYVIANDNK